jgi:hypothetical protein
MSREKKTPRVVKAFEDLGLAAQAARHSISEKAHAEAAKGITYDPECIVHLAGGLELRAPAFPLPCSYVRFVMNGEELMYWCSDEWKEDPEEVMGAIIGRMIG